MIPPGADVPTFLLSDGKLNEVPTLPASLRLAHVFAEFRRSLPAGALEANSLDTIGIHGKHFERILGPRFEFPQLKLGDPQRYIEHRSREQGRRGKPVSPTTLKKELVTLSGIWSWAARMELVHGTFPNQKLKYQGP